MTDVRNAVMKYIYDKCPAVGCYGLSLAVFLFCFANAHGLLVQSDHFVGISHALTCLMCAPSHPFPHMQAPLSSSPTTTASAPACSGCVSSSTPLHTISLRPVYNK